MNKNRLLIGILTGSAVVVGVGVYYFKGTRPDIQIPPASQNKDGVEGAGDFDVVIDPAPPAAEIAKPDLDRAIVVSDKTLSASSAKEVVEQLKVAIAAVKKNPVDYQAWINMGLYRKAIGDYKGAEEVWLYVLPFQKHNFAAANNLGNLYSQNLKDYPKAEKYYLMRVALQLDNFEGYLNLYHLYRNQYKEKEAQAPIILKQGIGENSNSPILMIELARYYKEIKDIESARTYYEKAADVAKKMGDIKIEVAIKSELQGL